MENQHASAHMPTTASRKMARVMASIWVPTPMAALNRLAWGGNLGAGAGR